MSTSNAHQQSIVDASSETRPPMSFDAGSETRPPMLERAPRMQKEEDLRDDLKHYEAKIEAMSLILISIPNDIYNSSDACTTAKAMWQRKLINASRAKKLEKSHDPLALVAYTGSSSRTSSPYYVTHPSSVVDYDDDYQGDTVQNNSDDPLTSVMILLARAITQNFSNLTNNRLHAVKQDEAKVILTDEQNDFLFADVSWIEEFKELSANICLMARIQPLNIDRSSNDLPFSVSNVIFDEPNEDVNSGSVEKDNSVQDLYELEQLARNAYKEAKKQQIIAKKVQQQNIMLTKQLELYNEKPASPSAATPKSLDLPPIYHPTVASPPTVVLPPLSASPTTTEPTSAAVVTSAVAAACSPLSPHQHHHPHCLHATANTTTAAATPLPQPHHHRPAATTPLVTTTLSTTSLPPPSHPATT
uniref:Uncharacterized protein n=1 Tax=Tanacetum cinerariifolium TaxID=118510 RepID=A0A6L2MGK1_TANCI|nr:hypothetical protein [Tanacetum cinerariifolium]